MGKMNVSLNLLCGYRKKIMNLIAQRPSTWNNVAGQQRAIDVIQAVLKNPRFLTRGIIFYGPLGVGKTTLAYVLAKALMCSGQDPLGCGKCPSCTLIEESGIDQHPDFLEVDGGYRSGTDGKTGVDLAREVVEVTLSLPVLGLRKVSIVDEAQYLSPEAWGAYLKVLEQGDTNSVFIFVSNEVEKIKHTITSRCIKIPLERVSNSTMLGLLSKIATENNIPYELDGLEIIARSSKGIIRDAVQWLNTAAALGTIKPRLVDTIIDTSLEDRCLKLLLAVGNGDQANAVKIADEIGLNFTTSKVVEVLLSIYGRAIWQEDKESDLNKVFLLLPNVNEVTSVLVKWSGLTVPADALPIVVYELLKIQSLKSVIKQPQTRTMPIVERKSSTVVPPKPRNSLSSFLEEDA